MTFIHNLTIILDDGEWGDVIKPYLCETPLFTEERIGMLRRAVLVSFQNETMGEIDIQRAYEGVTSSEVYNIKITSVSRSDVKNIAEQIRDIIILYGQVNSAARLYHSLDISGFVVEPELGNWIATAGIKAWTTGKER